MSQTKTTQTTTLFISCFHGIISKNILETDVLKILASDPGLRIVIFVPKYKLPFFEANYVYKHVHFEGIDTEMISQKYARSIATVFAELLIDSHYLWYKKIERREAANNSAAWIKFWLEILFTKLFAGRKISRSVFRFFEGMFSDADFLDPYFEKYRPSCLFSTDIFNRTDTLFLRKAKQRGVLTIGMVRSWDNCYSKGLLRIIPDKAITNNELIKEELSSIHGVRPADITVCGLPQFDRFIAEEKLSKQVFCSENGLDPNKRIIVYSPICYPLSDSDWEVLQLFKENLHSGDLPGDIQFIIRLHPGRELPLGEFVPDENFVFQKPGLFEKKDTEFSPQDTKLLMNTLYHADLVMWISTTMSLDAAVFDKPQIVVNFDGKENKTYIKSIRRYHDEDHMKRYLDIGGVTKVDTPDDMIMWMNRYLNDPTLNREKRETMVERELFCVDARSGERVAEAIRKEVAEHTS